MVNGKIFGIGLTKTGNKSLCQYLVNQGIKAQHFPTGRDIFLGDYQAYLDTPCVAHLDSIVRNYPDAKFIYTCRNNDDWITSCLKHFVLTENFKLNYYRQLVYGSFFPTAQDLINAKEALESKIQSINNLLILPLEENDKARQVNDFLGFERYLDYPQIP